MLEISQHQKQRELDASISEKKGSCVVCGLCLHSFAEAISHFNSVHKIKVREKPPIYPRELR